MVILQLDSEQLSILIQNAVRKALGEKLNVAPQPEPDQIFTAQETADFLGLALPTVYTKSSRGELPGSKRGKRLYFSKRELTEYIQQGRRKTGAEIEAEAQSYLNSRKRRG
jgi:excisionase family DNA binding protein